MCLKSLHWDVPMCGNFITQPSSNKKEDTIYDIGIFGVATDHKHALVN